MKRPRTSASSTSQDPDTVPEQARAPANHEHGERDAPVSVKGLTEVSDAVSGLASLHLTLKSAAKTTTELRELYRDMGALDAPLAVAIERIAQAADKIIEVKKALIVASPEKTSKLTKGDSQFFPSSPIKPARVPKPKGEVDEGLLHPTIRNFQVVADDKEIQRVMSDRNVIMKLERAVMVNPTNEAAAGQLRSFTRSLQVAYNEAISQRVAKKGLFKSCMDVIRAGTEGFQEVYHSVWNLVCQSERESFALYRQTVKDVRQSMPYTRHDDQLTADVVELYQQAALIKPKYDAFLQDLTTTCMAKYDFSIDLQLPSSLKSVSRIVEKAAMRHKSPGDASNTCDIVRGMLVILKMTHVTHVLQELSSNQSITIARIKERFLEEPSGGGWRDVMVNFYFREDPHRHMCEVQIAHELMLTARKGLPGHVIYGRTRNALELIEKRMGTGVTKDAVALANFWFSTGSSKLLYDSDEKAGSSSSSSDSSSRSESKEKSDSCEGSDSTPDGWLTDAPLGEWRGVTTSGTSGRVVGLDVRSKLLKGKVPQDLSALKCLEFLDLRDNASLVKPPGVPLDLAGEMHYSDLQGVQAFCKHICLTEEEQQAIAEAREFVQKYGPDGPALQSLFDHAGGKNWYKTLGGWQMEGTCRWFTGHDVRKWHGVTCDSRHRVQCLNLFGTNIKHALPEAIGNFPKLEDLSLKWCVGLTSLPESMAGLSALRTLDLSWCQGLRELPDGICCLVGLKRLYLRGCSEFLRMPQRFGAIGALQELDLSWCPKLSVLPDGLDGLHALQTLGLRGCQGLSDLPNELGHLPNLGSLYLADCLDTVRASECVESLSARGCKIFLK